MTRESASNTRGFFKKICSLGARSYLVLYLQDGSPLLLASGLHCPSVESLQPELALNSNVGIQVDTH